MSFIESQALFGRGIGLVEAHLLAVARVAPGTLLWTHSADSPQWQPNWAWPLRCPSLRT